MVNFLIGFHLINTTYHIRICINYNITTNKSCLLPPYEMKLYLGPGVGGREERERRESPITLQQIYVKVVNGYIHKLVPIIMCMSCLSFHNLNV